MNKIIIVILVVVIVIAGIWLLTKERDVIDEVAVFDSEKAREVAEEWIRENAATFAEREGFDLQYVDALEVEEGVYKINFEFKSNFAGYGPVKEDEMYAQVVTEHTIVIKMENGGIVSAITDGVYDEIAEKMITENLEEVKEIAENWIVNNSPTYIFDGSGLTFVDAREQKGERYELTFAFESRAAGYGDRSEEMAAQVITPHEMVVVIDQGEVVTAVTDGVYDEIAGEMIEETLPETMQIELYFIKAVENQEQIVAVERSIPYTIAPARAALEALLVGPLSHEEAIDLSTSIPKGTKLLDINIQGGIATADFSKELDEDVAGSAWVTAIRNQIEKTLMQFDTVDEVVIMVGGESEDVLQP